MFLANSTQKLAVRILEAHLKDGHIASSYIFSGREDASEMAEMASDRNSTDIKEEFAVAFACALENNDKKLFVSQDAIVSKRIWNHNYPDVRFLGEDRSERSIKIEAVRELIQWAYRKPYEGLWKVCVVPKAERLTEEAANAFLKTLEEPPKQTVFCLLVENKGHLLETIQSRSFEIRLTAMPFQGPRAGLSTMTALPVREIFESYPSLSRDEARQKIDGLMLLSREKIHHLVSQGDADEKEVRCWIDAMDLLYDSKGALDLNVNQKLMVTRLAMRLRRLFPTQRVVSL